MFIEKYFVLNKYFLSLFGAKDFSDIAEKLKNAEWNIDNDGRSYFYNVLFSAFGKIKILEEDLILYDQNIQKIIDKINRKREPKFLPKYFQYVALLFSEIFLDNLKNREREFLNELNKYLAEYKKETEIESIEEFRKEDLKKLAFYMATGSGKTLIMHANYYQFLHYDLFSPDNTILITPNEGLSQQHKEELEKSGIPCRLYTEGSGSFIRSDNEVLVIEITKFVEEKKGGGITLPVDAFEGRNLLLIDEGHKGKRSEDQKWAKLRNQLSENGFTFEYSATFGQILNTKNKRILEEYAKAIIFDYSYKYFYLDGYGKDFSVLNVKESKVSTEKFQEVMFVANLLSFYEQSLIFDEYKNLAKEYNLEKPLWIFVGTTVVKGKGNTERGKELVSDVLQIVDFLIRVSRDKDWIEGLIKKILEGETGLKNEKGEEIFKESFEFLRKTRVNFNSLYKKVFNGRGALGIFEIKDSEGELGLKLGDNDYFGVINIGNVSEFKKQIEEKLKIQVEEDVISSSLFNDIKKEKSPINVLIGAKKFIEGWDTWRVTSMGLLNIGKGHGPQIIQLFGRGIRLKGEKMSLKRSGRKEIKELETLKIYGIKANYLNSFLEAIEKEEVEFEVIKIPVIPQYKREWKELVVPFKDEKKNFKEEKILSLNVDPTINVEINLIPKIMEYSLGEEREIRGRAIEGEGNSLDLGKDVDLFNWEKIFAELLNYKLEKGYWNLVFSEDTIKDLLLSGNLNFLVPEATADEYTLLEEKEILLLGLKKYIERFYKKSYKKFDTENIKYTTLKKKQLSLLKDEEYTLQIKKREGKKLVNQELIKKIKKLAKNIEKLTKEESNLLPRVYFDRHLFLPVLVNTKKIDKITPEGLNESEEKFLLGLRKYIKEYYRKLNNWEIFVLRNFPAKGIGFQLEWTNFHPDFILWIKKENKQHILFIDPHGLIYSKGLQDEKVQFAKIIKEMCQKIKGNIKADSFILSPTPYEKLIEGNVQRLSRDEYEKNHVMFLEDKEWPSKLFSFYAKK